MLEAFSTSWFARHLCGRWRGCAWGFPSKFPVAARKRQGQHRAFAQADPSLAPDLPQGAFCDSGVWNAVFKIGLASLRPYVHMAHRPSTLRRHLHALVIAIRHGPVIPACNFVNYGSVFFRAVLQGQSPALRIRWNLRSGDQINGLAHKIQAGLIRPHWPANPQCRQAQATGGRL